MKVKGCRTCMVLSIMNTIVTWVYYWRPRFFIVFLRAKLADFDTQMYMQNQFSCQSTRNWIFLSNAVHAFDSYRSRVSKFRVNEIGWKCKFWHVFWHYGSNIYHISSGQRYLKTLALTISFILRCSNAYPSQLLVHHTFIKIYRASNNDWKWHVLIHIYCTGVLNIIVQLT